MAFAQFVQNEDFIYTEKTKLTAAAAAGQKAMTVANSGGFAKDNYVRVGWDFEDETEMVKLDTMTTVLALTSTTNLSFSHKRNEPVVKMKFNQRKLYGSATKTGTYTLVGSAVDIEVDNPEGTYLTDTGTTYSYYKVTYYNSTSTAETALADATIYEPENVEGSEVAVTNLGKYCTIADIRNQSGFTNVDVITDTQIDYKRLRASSMVDSYIATVYSLPLAEIPEIIKHVTSILASGFLLIDEYGSSSRDTDKDGYKKIEEAKSILKQIANKEIKLIGSTGTELASDTAGTVGFYPDDTTEPATEFSIDMDTQTF